MSISLIVAITGLVAAVTALVKTASGKSDHADNAKRITQLENNK
jgi:hypothetical protein